MLSSKDCIQINLQSPNSCKIQLPILRKKVSYKQRAKLLSFKTGLLLQNLPLKINQDVVHSFYFSFFSFSCDLKFSIAYICFGLAYSKTDLVTHHTLPISVLIGLFKTLMNNPHYFSITALNLSPCFHIPHSCSIIGHLQGGCIGLQSGIRTSTSLKITCAELYQIILYF